MAKRILSLTLSIILLMPWAAKSENVFGTAQWIGGNDEDMGLYAPYLTVFRLAWDVVGEDSDSWLRFGYEAVTVLVETHSAFDYVPGLLVLHSKDLVNWEPIGSAVNEYLGSIWAPDISKCDGKYYKAAGYNLTLSLYGLGLLKLKKKWGTRKSPWGGCARRAQCC